MGETIATPTEVVENFFSRLRAYFEGLVSGPFGAALSLKTDGESGGDLPRAATVRGVFNPGWVFTRGVIATSSG